MANVKSINGNPIVVGTTGIEDGAVTDAKLTQSGGVLDKVSNLRSALSEITGNIRYDFVSGYYNLIGNTCSSLTPELSTTYNCAYASCSEGDTFVTSLSGGVTAQAYAFLDTGLNILSKSGQSKTLTNNILIAPENSAYIVVNNSVSRTDGYLIKGNTVSNRLDDLKSRETTFEETIININKCVPDTINATYESGGIYPNTGNAYTNSKYIRIGFIPISGYATVKFDVGSGYFVGPRFYSSTVSNGFIESASNVTGKAEVIIKPAYKYMRFVIGRSDSDNISVSEATNVSSSLVSLLIKRINTFDESVLYKVISSASAVQGVAHRGYSYVAPENTAAAFKAAAKAGFLTIETDIRFTSDDIPVLIHDETVDRTSNGTGNVIDKTLEQLKALDFGSWFGSSFAGEQILTLAEGIALCKKLGLKMILEVKTWAAATTEALYKEICDTIKEYDYAGNVYIMYDVASALANFSKDDTLKNVPLMLLQSSIDENIESRIVTLKNASNNVYVAVDYSNLGDEDAATILGLKSKLFVYTVDSEASIISMNGGICGVISNKLNAPVVLYNSAAE